MISIESSRNRDLIFRCEDTDINRTIIHLIVAIFNMLDSSADYTIGGLHWKKNWHQNNLVGNI